mgnify:CR=1 FL=1
MLTKKDTTQLLQAFRKVFATKQEAKKQHNDVVQKLETVQGDIKTMKGDINLMKDDIKTVQVDIQSMKGDIKVVQGDVKIVQGDVQSVKDDIKTVQVDIQSMKGDIKTVQETLSNLTDMTRDILSWTDDIHKEIVQEKLPQRVHRIEKHLGFPVLAD